MSLTVSPQLLEQAERGEVDDASFTACIASSLPYAWSVVTGLVNVLRFNEASCAVNQITPPDEEARGQLLRFAASDAMRAAAATHFGVRLAFQNCHALAVFDPDAAEEYAEFTSARAQVLNQSPELVNC
jgi:hypothetical protein